MNIGKYWFLCACLLVVKATFMKCSIKENNKAFQSKASHPLSNHSVPITRCLYSEVQVDKFEYVQGVSSCMVMELGLVGGGSPSEQVWTGPWVVPWGLLLWTDRQTRLKTLPSPTPLRTVINPSRAVPKLPSNHRKSILNFPHKKVATVWMTKALTPCNPWFQKHFLFYVSIITSQPKSTG